VYEPVEEILLSHGGFLQMLTSIVSDEHLERVLFYARFIRVLSIVAVDHEPNESYFPESLFSAILSRINKLNAFSSLRKLVVFQFDFLHEIQYTILFLISTPNLEAIELTSAETTSEITTSSFIQLFTSDFHHLKTLDVRAPFTGIGIFQSLSKFYDLQHLSLDLCLENSDGAGAIFPIPTDLLRHSMSSMVALQSLKLHLRNRPLTATRTAHHLLRLDSLTDLEVDGTMDDIEIFLDILYAPLLDSLRLTFMVQCVDLCTDGPSRRYTITRLDEPLAKLQLRTLSLSIISSPSPINFYFSPSLQKVFEQLEVFRMNCNADLFISTSRLNTFLYDNNWSNLEDLELTHRRLTGVRDGTLSIAAMLSVASACPKLVKLTIAIRHPDKSCMETATLSDTVSKPHGLKVLKFVALPSKWLLLNSSQSTSLAITFSFFLHCLFPRLQIADYDPTFLGSDSNNAVADWPSGWWTAVRRMLEKYRMESLE
jgi:hypothetical protein